MYTWAGSDGLAVVGYAVGVIHSEVVVELVVGNGVIELVVGNGVVVGSSGVGNMIGSFTAKNGAIAGSEFPFELNAKTEYPKYLFSSSIYSLVNH